MSYNPLPQPATSVVLTGAGTSVVTFANPFPVSLGSSSITINGSITIPTTVSVASSPANPVHNHITEVGTSDILTVPYLPVGIGTTNLNLSYLPVGISSLLNTVSISNTSFYVLNPVTTVAVSGIGSTVTVQGTVGIGTTGQVSLNLNSAPVSSTNPLPVVSTASTTAQFVQFIDKTNTQLDSANRLRVATSGQQIYYVPTIDKDGDYKYNESFVGTGCTSAFEQNIASIRYTSGISTNGYYTRGSRRRFKMRPGISNQWYGIINWNGRQTNCTKRRGLFTAFNGVFYEVTDDLYVVVRRRLLDGTLVEDRIKRTSFSNDTLNGTGPSGYNFETVGIATITSLVGGISTVVVNSTSGETYYNQTYSVANGILPMSVGQRAILTGIADTSYNGAYMIKAIGAGNTTVTLSYPVKPSGSTTITNGQLYHDSFLNVHTFWFDFNGDRTCRLRFGIETTEGTSVLHIINYGDTLGSHFSNAPSIMDRTEIFNTGITSYAPSMLVSGTAFNIEAEVELNPYFGTAVQTTATTFTHGNGQTLPILGLAIRSGEPYQRADVQIQNVNIIDAAAAGNGVGNNYPGSYFYQLTLNPTIGGTGIASTSFVGKATEQFTYTTGSTISGGIPLISGFFVGQSSVDVSTSLNFLNMGSNLTYTASDVVVLSVKEITGGSGDGKIVASLDYIENL